jgi:hypothetical protein
MVRKRHDDDRWGSHGLRSREERISLVELLQPPGQPGDFLGGAVADYLEMGSPRFQKAHSQGFGSRWCSQAGALTARQSQHQGSTQLCPKPSEYHGDSFA